MAHLRDERGNPIHLSDKDGYPVKLTDEFGNPMHLSGVVTSNPPHEVTSGIIAEHPIGAPTVDQQQPQQQKQHHSSLQEQLRRSGSSSSSSSEDDGQGGRRKKKGLKEKIKDKFSSGNKKDDPTAPVATSGPTTTAVEHPVPEKKGFMEKIKDKLPGHHSHHP